MPDLPSVQQEWIAETARYVANMAEAIAVTEEFAATIDNAVGDVLKLQAAIDALHGTDLHIGVDAAQAAAAAAATENLAGASRDAGAGMAEEAAAAAASAAAERDAAGAALEAAAAISTVAAAARDAAAADQDLGRELYVAYGGLTAVTEASRVTFTSESQLASMNQALAASFGESSDAAITADVYLRNVAAAGVDVAVAELEAAAAAQAEAAALIDVSRNAAYLAAALGLVSTANRAAMLSSAQLAAANRGVAASFADMGRSIYASAGGVTAVTAADRAAFMSAKQLDLANRELAVSFGDVAAAAAISASFTRMTSAAAADAAVRHNLAATAVKGFGAATAGAAAATRIWGLSLTAWHWIFMGVVDFLAVAIPAMIAFGAGALVAAQGALNTAHHMTALYNASEATANVMHKSVGDILGVGHALQTAQDAANPGVYAILGSAVNAAKTSFTSLSGTGLTVVRMLDEFAARVNVDLKGALGGQLNQLTKSAATDLQMLAQVFGNLGHALLSAGAAMPGVAELLLTILRNASGLISAIAQLPPWILTSVMALEEFTRWGGLAAAMLVKLLGASDMLAASGATNFVTRFGAALSILVSLGGNALMWAGQFIGRLAGMSAIAGTAGTAITRFGGMVAGAAGAMGPLGWAAAGIAAAGIGFLIYKLVTAKTATEQWISSTNAAVAAASNMQVLNTIGQALAANSVKLAAAEHQVAATAASAASNHVALSRGVGTLVPVSLSASSAVSDLTAQQKTLIGTATTVTGNIGYLAAAFHTSATGALGLATAAGVDLKQSLTDGSTAAQIMLQQIKNLQTGLGAMGAQTGIIGADMAYMGIQSQLAATKVSQVNQAFDQWMSSVTGSMSAWSAFTTAMSSMGTAAAATSSSMSGAIGSVSSKGAAMTYTLNTALATSAQSWQQFIGAVTSAGSAIDILRTGMAEGAVGTGLFTSNVQAMVGQLIPFAQGNKAAATMIMNLATAAGGPATTSLKALASWAGVTGSAAAKQLAAGMQAATVAMGNTSAVAQNLSAVVNSQVDASLSAAILKTSGVTAATNNYVAALNKYGPNAWQTVNAQNALNQALAKVYSMGQSAASAVGNAGNAAFTAGQKMSTAASQAQALASGLRAASGHWTATFTTYYNSVVNTPTGTNVGGVAQGLFGKGHQHGGVIPGMSAGFDTVPHWVTPGEGILVPQAVRMLGAGWVNAANAAAEQGLSPAMIAPGGTGAGGGGGVTVHVHMQGQMDGRAVWENMQTRTLIYGTRNSNQPTGVWKPS
jgi:hypothetical protein